MVNYIFVFLISIGIFYGFITGNTIAINNEILNVGEYSLNIILKLFPIMCLWLGLMNIASQSGLLDIIAKKISKVLKYIFKEIPENHEVMALISLNIVMNMVGLGNAATPIGLKAIKSLNELNKNKDTPSKSMQTFLILNTTGLTIVPTSILALRMSSGSTNPSIILPACIITTILSTVTGLIINYLFNKKRGNLWILPQFFYQQLY